MGVPLRVVVASQSYPRHRLDPHGTFVATHAAALAAAGVVVTVVAPAIDGAPAHERAPLDITRFRYAPRRFEHLAGTGAMHHEARGATAALLAPYLVANAAAIRRASATSDLVHAHWWVPTGMAAVFGARHRTPVVLHIHGTDAAMAPVGSARAGLAGVVLRKAAAVLAVSEDLARWAQAVSGVESLVAPMAIDPSHIATASPAPADGPLLAVGRLVPEKGFEALIQAAARLGTPVVLAGDGPQRARLEALADARHAPVEFLGAVAPDQLPALYRAARAVVVPSRREGFGLVAAEAAASGRTVIATAVGGLVDIVKPGVNGVLIPPGDVAALMAAIESIDPALGAAGPASVAHLTPTAVAAREVSLYRTLLGRAD